MRQTRPDGNDLVVAPAKRGRTPTKGILPLCALDILYDLSHRRLPDVKVSAPFEVLRLNFKRCVHAVLRSLIVMTMPASA
jgi:hypothetical protein